MGDAPSNDRAGIVGFIVPEPADDDLIGLLALVWLDRRNRNPLARVWRILIGWTHLDDGGDAPSVSALEEIVGIRIIAPAQFVGCLLPCRAAALRRDIMVDAFNVGINVRQHIAGFIGAEDADDVRLASRWAIDHQPVTPATGVGASLTRRVM
jgi:hypothetical protein